jgi:ParB/RepB/Spo0J family partition protein
MTMSIEMLDPALLHCNAWQPAGRISFTDDQLADLASIQTLGLQQIPKARPHPTLDGQFEMIFGWRRRCAWLLFRPTEPMPVDVVQATDAQAFDMAAVENGQREDLSAIDKARLVATATRDFGKSQLQAGQLVGLRSQGAVSNLIHLLDLPEAVQAKVAAGTLPERLARPLVAVAKVANRNNLEGVALKIAEADPADRDDVATESTADLLDKTCYELSATYSHTHKNKKACHWDLNWKPTTPAAIEGKQEIPPACRQCPSHVAYNRDDYCARPACYDAKITLWQDHELKRVSAKLGIPILGPGKSAAPLDISYRNEDVIKAALKSKKHTDALFLMADTVSLDHSYNHHNLLGSDVLLLASTDPRLFDRKADAPVPVKQPDETPAQSAKRVAAEEKEAAARREEKSIRRRSQADILWLVRHTAEMVEPQMIISGGVLDLAREWANRGFISSHDWPEMNALQHKLLVAVGSDKDKRTFIVAQILWREIAAFSADEQYSWSRACRESESAIIKTFKLKLQQDWNQPPIHHTDSNCWVCGTFTSMDHITKRDEEEGWTKAKDGTVTCSDKCRAQLSAKAPAQPQPAAKPKTPAKRARSTKRGTK